MNARPCPTCATPVDAGRVGRCLVCGQRLQGRPAASAVARPALVLQEKRRARLVGTPVRIRLDTLVGRGADLDPGTCAEGAISARHAALFWRDGWQVRDQGSLYGTFLNGRRITVGTEHALTCGDTLGFADRLYAVRIATGD